MTENEELNIDDCLKELKKHRDVYLKRCTPWRIVNRAIRLIEQYRAIGTIEEFKAYKLGDCMNDCEHYENCSNYIYSKGYNKAIDDFVKEIEAEYDNDGCPNVTDYLDYKISIRDLHKIADQLKGGAE